MHRSCSYISIGRSRVNISSRRRPQSSNIQISRTVASSPRSSSVCMSTLASSPRPRCSRERPLEPCKLSPSPGPLHALIIPQNDVFPAMDRCQRHSVLCTVHLPVARPYRQHSLFTGNRCRWYRVSPSLSRSSPKTQSVFFSMFVATIPAVLYVDKLGRKPILISGAFLMAACHIIVAVLTGMFHNSWDTHSAAGWGACALVWVFAVGACR